MNLSVMDVISAVLTNINVIIATIAVVLYLNFVVYVVRYRKKPPKVRNKKKVIAQAPTPAPESEEGEEE